ncbi:sulfonate ABC transporter substrate-binding protein [Bradyrhizobium sp. CB82]|uniref:sulfonate ABC transporter substrate-binding protein n=1 Tax=Bradyrhizobium sp. CB82 TaxID=3039159 RepID=UPI0024B23062|nr:sulfonate ABC transporter substrate-binding protein [Bradyrhizobium sp. CB82]WFU39693.1 sulfonate ABC transporter substrate-binding protein [Bradyrhizobium sp. CB82]
MRHLFQRWISIAVLSVGIVSVAVGTSYGQDKVLRIGYQKYGKLVLLKSKGTLEPKLAAEGYKVEWTEFPSGPPLLEALNVGSIDFGNTGEAPPIFAQAAGAPIRYVAYEPPAPRGEAILVPKDSPLKLVAELRGKKVALNKGSNVHYLLVKALEKAGVNYSEIEPVFLAPADARAAFERGAVDAWVIWDPFQAAAEAATGARTLADGTDIVANYQFYFSSNKFLDANPKIIDAVLAELSAVDDWAKGDIHAVAEQLAPAIGLSVPVVEVALKRQAYGIKPLSDAVIADQQQVADAFFALGLIPKSIKISYAARRPGS